MFNNQQPDRNYLYAPLAKHIQRVADGEEDKNSPLQVRCLTCFLSNECRQADRCPR